MNRVVHFEIQAEEPVRAAKFYKDVFGWNIEKYTGEGIAWEYWMIMTAPTDSKDLGINGGIQKRPAQTPPPQCGTNAFTCTIDVINFDETSKKILSAGGKIALPKFALPKMAWQGYFLDTEGNVFGIHEQDINAA